MFCIIYQCSGILQSVCQWFFSENLLYSLIKELAMVANMNRNLLYEIWGSHIGGYEDYALVEWDTMQFGRFLLPLLASHKISSAFEIEASCSSKIWCVYQTANHHMPEDSGFQKLWLHSFLILSYISSILYIANMQSVFRKVEMYLNCLLHAAFHLLCISFESRGQERKFFST